MSTSARISRLTIAAHRRRGMTTVQSVVEDAFRTQLSVLGPAARTGLLVVRKVELGQIASRRDQGAVNARLRAILRSVSGDAEAMTAGQIEAAQAVRFRDPIAPLLEAARAVAEGRPVPRTWPYRAVLGPAIFASGAELSAHLVALAGCAEAPGTTVERVIATLAPRLAELAPGWPREVVGLALHCLVAGPVSDRPSDPVGEEVPVLRADLRAVVALTARRPGVARHLARGGDAAVRRLLLAEAIRAGARPVSALRLDRIEMLLEAFLAVGAGQGAAALDLRACLEAVEARIGAAEREGSGVVRIPLQEVAREVLLAAGLAGRIANEAERPEPQVDKAPGAAGVPEARQLPPDTVAPGPDAAPGAGFAPTAVAGIAFLFNLVNRSLADQLNGAEHLSAATGQHLVKQIMGRLAVEPGDAWCAAEAAFDPLPPAAAAPLSFALDAGMVPASPRRVRICRIAGYPGMRAACLGPLRLAHWKGRAPGRVRALLEGRAIGRGRRVSAIQKPMLTAMEFGLRRHLRQGPKLTMAGLVGRHGRMARTETHLEVLFDASVIDLAIRKWALDINPGWCPWLWWVVAIHYDFGGFDAE